MTTLIALPDDVAVQLQHQAAIRNRSVEALAIEYIVAALDEQTAAPADAQITLDDDNELLEIVARIKAMPPNPANIIPAQGNLAAVLLVLEAIEIPGYDLEAEIAALRAAEDELREINRADDIAEGRG